MPSTFLFVSRVFSVTEEFLLFLAAVTLKNRVIVPDLQFSITLACPSTRMDKIHIHQWYRTAAAA
ncbi:hypothetical protein [Paenibacillus sp. N3.4]|uniref:hypothetical protein n=1 Tax=Paenibacillus sp. N3.4 TaxID=2603222 RepID=UPI00164FB731|nr:hypothetical protein [Paenibacillus sp. N3.4]